MCMCMYVCVSVYMCMCMYVCVSVYMCMCMYVCVSVYMCMCMYVCVSVYMCMCMYVCVSVYMCMCMYVCVSRVSQALSHCGSDCCVLSVNKEQAALSLSHISIGSSGVTSRISLHLCVCVC